VAFQCLKGGYKKEGGGLFSTVCYDRTRGNGLKLKEGRFRLDVRKKLFNQRVVRHWHRCPEKLWVPHARRCLRPDWKGPWAA